MADVIRMPKLGFDMAEGTLVRWMIQEGEAIAKGEVIAEIETDKATVEVEAQTGGTLHKHLVQEGTLVNGRQKPVTKHVDATQGNASAAQHDKSRQVVILAP